MTREVEAIARRRVMKRYVEDDAEDIVLKRPTFEPSGVGGKRRAGAQTLRPQRFMLYPMVRRMTSQVQDKPEGDIPKNLFVLVGSYDADVKAGDFFRLEGQGYIVESVYPEHVDRTAAPCVWHGEVPEDWNGT